MQKAAIVSGGARGIGYETAKLLARTHKVYVLDSSHKPASYRRDIEYVMGRTDVESDVNALMCSINEPIGIVVNNASIGGVEWFENLSSDDILNVLKVNLLGYALFTQKALKHSMLKFKEGIIINLTSIASYMPMRASWAYNVTKAGQVMMVKQWAREFASRKIYTIGISPCRVDGTRHTNTIDNQVKELRNWSIEEIRKATVASIPVGKALTPADVARFISTLVDNFQPHMNGSDFKLSGGL
jgi:3-oxoacyl-[acyl-carrier protein] reductase